MIKRNTCRKKGFTLVELIVVIAIIAILASISLAGFSRYINQARLSNDNQVAASMTKTLDLFKTQNQGIELDAQGVRDIIIEASGGEFDFTPSARNVGYFYVSEIEEIIVASYDDMADPTFVGALLNTGNPILLNQFGNSSEEFGKKPEEIFGESLFLLTTEGSIVAETVSAIRNLGNNNNPQAKYDDLLNNVDSLGGFLSDDTHKQLLEDFLEYFSPQHTAYVSNQKWFVQKQPEFVAWAVQTVVFSEDIVHIPKYPEGRITVYNDVSIPRSVRTIEKDAFTTLRFNDRMNHTFKIPNDVQINIEEDAFSPQFATLINSQRNIDVFTIWPTMTFSIIITFDGVETTYDSETLNDDTPVYIPDKSAKITVDIEELEDRSSITGLSLSMEGDVFIVRVFSENGLSGISFVPVTYNPE
jgi:prepilin-type N-terminal cleavage/methylation domain-containing protein